MKVSTLIQRLQECDPHSDVELRISDKNDSGIKFISIPHKSTRYQWNDESWQDMPEPGSCYETLTPNTVLITNWFMSSSYND